MPRNELVSKSEVMLREISTSGYVGHSAQPTMCTYALCSNDGNTSIAKHRRHVIDLIVQSFMVVLNNADTIYSEVTFTPKSYSFHSVPYCLRNGDNLASRRQSIVPLKQLQVSASRTAIGCISPKVTKRHIRMVICR
jgi:hypothetical protein